MKINFTDTLFNLLKQENSFLDYKKELAKNKVVEVARNKNNEKHTELLKLLLSNETVKNEFFYEIDGITVFDREHFTSYMKNKNFLNDSFTKFDQQIGFNIKDKMNDSVVLNWAYKDCILEGGQSSEEKGKNEIFFNEILAKSEISRLLEPKALTNLKRVSGENKEQKLKEFKKNDKGEITDNLLIKGNNLLALHSLKEKF
ncbi:MAG: site-specific DNA-methyltransferase, partial [Alphaproteobacteria bacterium]